jgi:hypothetical protein
LRLRDTFAAAAAPPFSPATLSRYFAADIALFLAIACLAADAIFHAIEITYAATACCRRCRLPMLLMPLPRHYYYFTPFFRRCAILMQFLPPAMPPPYADVSADAFATRHFALISRHHAICR